MITKLEKLRNGLAGVIKDEKTPKKLRIRAAKDYNRIDLDLDRLYAAHNKIHRLGEKMYKKYESWH